MNKNLLIFGLLPLLLVGCDFHQDDIRPEYLIEDVGTLSDWINAYDTNYTRETSMDLTLPALQHLTEVQNGLHFPFTCKRTTLWNQNTLYMTTLNDQVNAGYYSVKENGHDQLYRYVIDDEKPSIKYKDATHPELVKSSKQTGFEVSVLDFFVNMETFKAPGWADKFIKPDDCEYYSSSDPEVLQQFLAFTASCYLNKDEDGSDYLTFTEARVYKGGASSDLKFELYVEPDLTKVSNEDGLFSTAIVSDLGTTEIPMLDAYLENL